MRICPNFVRGTGVQRGYQMDGHLKQMLDRMNSLLVQGHEVDKLIIEGGTYTEYPSDFLEEFHRDSFMLPIFYDNPKRKPLSIQQEMNINMLTKVELSVFVLRLDLMLLMTPGLNSLKYGNYSVQLGVQHTDNKILKKINRGHTFEDSVERLNI